MRKEYLGSKLLNDWLGLFLILLIFGIDTGLGNIYKLYPYQDQITDVYRYRAFKEIFCLIPYLLLIVISLNIRVRFDKFDIAILFTCLLLTLLNCVDYFVNYNWRPQWTDWFVFFSITIPAVFFKYLTYSKK